MGTFKTYLHKRLKYVDMLLNVSVTVTQLYPDSNSNSLFQTPAHDKPVQDFSRIFHFEFATQTNNTTIFTWEHSTHRAASKFLPRVSLNIYIE